jgi:vacuolar-type H+-ATPase subunit F/Vma7
MRRTLTSLVIVSGMFLVSLAAVNACGDKALRIGRGIRFQRAVNPKSILIYIPSNVTRASQVQSLLKKVGHKPYWAQSDNNLSEALKSGKYDLVFTDLGVAENLRHQIDNSSSKPVLVAVVSEGTKAEVKAAQKQYNNIVKNPHNAVSYLEAIEVALRSKPQLSKKG